MKKRSRGAYGSEEKEMPEELDVDGRVDSRGVKFIGKAKRQPDGTWHCLADVGGALCIVEVKVTFLDDDRLYWKETG